MLTQFDTVVIGGGLLGCVTSWMLAQEGTSVLLVEKDQINQHASGQNAGSLHYQLEYRMMEHGLEKAKRAAEAMPLHLHAARLWSTIARDSGEDIKVRKTGGLMLAETRQQAMLLEQKAKIERDWGLDVQVLDSRELSERAPYLSPTVLAASYCQLEGKADARTAAPALARAALRNGATICTKTEIQDLKKISGGWKVTLSRPAAKTRIIRTSAVIIAAGVWTSAIGEMLGASLPTIPLALMMTVTARVPTLVPHLVQHAGARLSLKQAIDGNILIGGGWPARLFNNADGRPDFNRKPNLSPSSLVGNASVAISAVPALKDVPVLRSWVGVTTVTPDQLPLVGEVPGAPGVFVATGGSAFTLGPSFAESIVAHVLGKKPPVELRQFDPMRFNRR